MLYKFLGRSQQYVLLPGRRVLSRIPALVLGLGVQGSVPEGLGS